jgi:hypothetical protein
MFKTLTAVVSLLVLATQIGTAKAAHHGYPAFWLRESRCITWHESRDEWHIRDGGFQIIRSTWQSFQSRGWADAAELNSPARQRLVAWRIWIHNGRSWGRNNQWPNTAAACGVY